MASSEKQIPQVVEDLSKGARWKEALERAELRPRQVRYEAMGSGEFRSVEFRLDRLLFDRSRTVAESVQLQRLELVPSEEQIPQIIEFTEKRCKSEDLLDTVRLRVKQAL